MSRLEFSAKIKDQAATRASGHCEKCHLPFYGRRPEFHHILECAFGGKPTLANCLCVCRSCHQELSANGIKAIRKSDHQRRKNVGAEQPKQEIAQRVKPEKEPPRFDKTPLPRRALYEDI